MKLSQLLCFPFVAVASAVCGQSNHSQLFFDSSGSDQAGYAGNQIITISGNVTYYGRTGPQPSGPGASLDYVQPASDVYVVPAGWWTGGQADGLPLEDVSNAPNTILGAGGGGFFEEPIATTHPQGSLISGDYDVIFDEHQDGAFQSHLDFYAGHRGAPAISVRVPADAPSLPGSGIAAMKLKATRQYEAAVPLQGAWVGIQNIMDPQARLLEAVTKLGEGTAQPGDFALNYAEILEGPVMLFYATFIFLRNQLLPQFKQADDFMAMPFSAATAAIENKMKRAVGLAADPPDPNFAVPVQLPPRRTPNGTNMDPLARAMAAAGATTDEEQRLAAGLLAALEKYQGADAAGDPRWCLAHARTAKQLAALLEAQTARSVPALTALRQQLAAYPVNLDAVAAVLAGRQAVVRNNGWTPAAVQALAAAGASGADMAAARDAFLAMNFSFSLAASLAALDAAIAAPAASAGYGDLAGSLDAPIAALLTEPSLDKGDPLISLAGPFTGTARTPVALTATGSDPLGREVTFDWDLDGDGAYDDAQGAVISHAWPAAFAGHIGVQVTNAAGRTAHAWAHVTITGTNRPPVLAGLTPRKGFVESETGNALTFHAEASDPDGQPVTIQWLLDSEPVATGMDHSFTPSAAQAGVHALVAKASDGQGGETTHVWLLLLKKPGTALTDLSVTMEAPETPVQTGTEFTWTITVENHGAAPAQNVALTQTLPAGLTFVRSSTSFGTSGGSGNQATANFGMVAAGGLVTLWVQTTAAAAGTYQSSATVSSDTVDFDAANNTAAARVRANAPSPQSADVSITGTVAPTPATVGGTQMLTFTTANAGLDGATGLVLEAQLPESVEFISATPAALSSDDGLVRIALPDVASGASTAATVTVRPSQAGSGPARAQVFAAQGDPRLSNNQTEVLLSAVFVPPPISDLALIQTATASPRAGLPATWTITVTNNGPDAAANVSLEDVLPAGALFVSSVPAPASLGNGRASFALGTLANGASRKVTLTVKPPFAGEAFNSATAISDSRDANGAVSVSAVNLLAAPITNADVSATLSASPDSVIPGGLVTITLTLANAGPDAATGVTAALPLPGGLAFVSATGGATHTAGIVTASVPSLANGAQSVFTITAAATAGAVLSAEVSSADIDPDASDNRSTAPVTVQNAPPQPVDLAVSQLGPASSTIGDALKVHLIVTNRGPGAASGVTLQQTLPAAMSFGAATTDQGTVSHNASLVTAQLGTLAANETARVEVTMNAQSAGEAVLTATVSTSETELNATDNAASSMITILPPGPAYLKSTYRFDDTLAACEPGAPPLVAIDPANADGFVTANVNGRTRRVYRWDGSAAAGQTAGLSVNAGALTPADNYSVELLFRYTENAAVVRRIVDTTDRAAAGGVSLDEAGRVVAGTGSAGTGVMPPQEFRHLVLTVAPGGAAETWLDGVMQNQLAGQTGLHLPASGLLHFFAANLSGGGSSDYADGEIALLRVYEGVLPPNRIASQAAYPFGPDATMDARVQFSTASNPAGVWSCGHSTTRGTPFLFDALVAIGTGGGILDYWTGTGSGPFIARNTTLRTIAYNSVLQPPDLLNFDPSFDARNAVLRWTAPVGGVYRVQGRFQGIDVSPNGTDVALLKNGNTATTLFDDYVLGFGQRKPFDVTVTLAAGETVDFSVGIGGNSFTFDGTGVDAVVTPVLLTDECASGTDVAVRHTPSDDVMAPGEASALELTVSNLGPRPAPGVILTSAVPAGITLVGASAERGTVQQSAGAVTITLGTLAPGETRRVSLLVSAAAGGTFTHTAQVRSGAYDSAPGNNTSAIEVTAGPVTRLSATVRTTVDRITTGGEAVFEMVMANPGTLPATGAALSVPVPAGSTFVSSTGGVLQNGKVIFSSVTLAAGQVAGYSLRLRADAPGALTVTALASSTNPPVRDGSGSGTVTVVPATLPPALQVTISTDPAQLHAGCRFTATYTVTNSSPIPASGVTLTGLIPPTFVVTSVTSSQGNASVSAGRLQAALGAVTQGTPVIITLAALATAAESSALSATVSGTTLAGSIIHLWDFNEPAGTASSSTVLHDLAGEAHATVRGTGAITTGRGIILPGGNQNAAPYIDLPNHLVSRLKQVTFEGWLTVNAVGTSNWGHVFSFGSNAPGGENGEIFGPGNTNGGSEDGLDYIALTSSISTDDQQQRFAVRDGDPIGHGEAHIDTASLTVAGRPIHFAVTADNSTAGRITFRYYRDGVFKGELVSTPFYLSNLSDLNDVNNWLGRGNFIGFPHVPCTWDEFRLYDRALTAAEVQASRLAGPNAFTGAVLNGTTPASTAKAFIRRNIAIPPPGSPCATPVALSIFAAPVQQSYRLEWTATPGRKYLIQSSPDLLRWINVPSLHAATSTNETWTDPGPPATERAPALDSERFYRVLELAE